MGWPGPLRGGSTPAGRLLIGAALFAAVAGGVRAAPIVLVSDDTYLHVWAIDADSGQALRGFTAPQEVVRSTLSRVESGLAFAGGEVFYTHSSSRRVWVLEAEFGRVQRSFPKPAMEISGLAAGGGSLFAVSSTSREGTVYELDPRDGSVLRSLLVPGARRGLAYAASRRSFFVNVGSLEIREVDAASGESRQSITPPGDVSGLGFSDADGVLLLLTSSGALHRLDPDSRELLGSIALEDTVGNPLARSGGLAVGPPIPPPAPHAPGTTKLQLQEMDLVPGASVPVPIRLTSEREVQAFVVAAIHDPAVLRLEEFDIEGTVSRAAAADFVAGERRSNGGSLGVVADLIEPFEKNALPSGENLIVGHFVYSCILMDLEEELTTEVRLVNGAVGDPQKDNVVVVDGTSFRVDVESADLTCTPLEIRPGGPEFLCGSRQRGGGPLESVEVGRGEVAELCFFYRFPQPDGEQIQGVSMALAYDCRLDCLESTFNLPPESITAEIEADFVDFQCDNDPDDGDGCEMVLGILADSLPPFGDSSLPATDVPLLLGCVGVEVSREADAGDVLEIRFQDGVDGRGMVPIRNLASVDNHTEQARLLPCEIRVVTSEPTLLCGSGTIGEDGLPSEPTGGPGEEVDLWFWYRSPGDDLFALTQALRFDCRLECLEGTFEIAPGAPELLDADLVDFHCENDPDDGDPCEMVLQLVLGTPADPGAAVLPATNVPRRIAKVRLRISEAAVGGNCLLVEHQDGVNGARAEPLDNAVEIASGSTPPATFDCRVCVVPARPPKFFCGGAELGPDGLPTRIGSVPRGGRAELCFWYSSPIDDLTGRDEIQGLSMALSFDCSLTCIESSFRVPDDSITAAVGAEFVDFNCDNDPQDGDGCEMVLGILVDFLPPFDGRTLPPSETPLKLACVEMEVPTRAKLGACLAVEFRDNVDGRGDVPIKNLVSAKSRSISPELFDCEICVEFLGPKFLCGAGELGADRKPLPPGGAPGEAVELCFWYCSPQDNAAGHEQFDNLQGLSMALEFDCRLQCIEESFRVPEDSITAALDADFVEFHCDNSEDDGDGCEMVLAILLDAAPPFDGRTLPATGEPLKLACVDMALPGDGLCGECFDVTFVNGVNGRGQVPVFNLVAAENHSFLAITNDCEICVTSQGLPEFLRGDCNFDGRVDVSDAAEVVSALFGEGTWQPIPPCPDACDANDDGRFDLADAFTILHYLFRFGPPPLDPGPDRPGPDPTPDKLDCFGNLCP